MQQDRRYAGAHRVEVDVTTAAQQVVGATDQTFLVFTFPERAGAPVARIQLRDVVGAEEMGGLPNAVRCGVPRDPLWHPMLQVDREHRRALDVFFSRRINEAQPVLGWWICHYRNEWVQKHRKRAVVHAQFAPST